MPTLGEKEWNEHAALIGAVTLAWNRNVHQILRIFCHLTGLESPLADAIFFSHQSDRSQRLLVKQVAKAVGLDEANLKTLEKLIGRLNDAAPDRNLAAHTIFGVTMFDPDSGAWGVKVVPALATPQGKRLEADFNAQFRRVEHELGAIYEDLEAWLLHTPFPDRSWGHPPFPKAAKLAAELATEAIQEAPSEANGLNLR